MQTAWADECPGNPNALGTSRTMTVDTSAGLSVGLQYHHDLPLKNKEVVLTFDDGPLPLYSERVRKALKAECVQATYFLVGKNALAYPEFVRKLAADGHSIGTHTMTHAMNLNQLTEKKALSQVDRGIAAVASAMKTSGNPENFAPFFRFPGLNDNAAVRKTLQKRGMGVFDIDAEGGDWLKEYSSDDVLKRVMNQLRRERKGIVLLHDIQPRTAAMVPAFLRQLKKEGYKVVHIIPAQPVISDEATIASADTGDVDETAKINGLRSFAPENDATLMAAVNTPVMPEAIRMVPPPANHIPPVGNMNMPPQATINPQMAMPAQPMQQQMPQQMPPSQAFAAHAPNDMQMAIPVTAKPAGMNEEKAHRANVMPRKNRLNPALLRRDRAQDDIEKIYAERRKLYSRRTTNPSQAYAPQQHYAEVASRPQASKYILNSLFESLRGTN